MQTKITGFLNEVQGGRYRIPEELLESLTSFNKSLEISQIKIFVSQFQTHQKLRSCSQFKMFPGVLEEVLEMIWILEAFL